MNLLTSCFGRKILEAAKQALITHIREEVRRLVDKYALMTPMCSASSSRSSSCAR